MIFNIYNLLKRAHGMPILFSHAGFRPKMIEYISSDYRKLYGNNQTSPEYLSEYVNRKVKDTVNKVSKIALYITSFSYLM